MRSKVFLALGSNKGDRLKLINQAIDELKKNRLIKITQYSSIYYTKPYGFKEQENFINMVIEIDTDFDLAKFHSITKEIEKKVGRSKTHRWGPREIDLDILLFNDMVFSSDKITIPHKEISNRDFFLVPLFELNPHLIHPATKILFSEYLNSLRENYILAKEIFKTKYEENLS